MTIRQDIEKGFPVWFVQNGNDDSLSREDIWELLVKFSEMDSELSARTGSIDPFFSTH